MGQHHSINYIEIPASDIAANKLFFKAVFAWRFVDYGDAYCAFSDGALNGGFYRSASTANVERGSVLIVFYSEDLLTTQQKIISCGGKIIKDVFTFPGGRRFHFSDPSNNEYAVWSE